MLCDICSDPNMGCGANSKGMATVAVVHRERQNNIQGGRHMRKTDGDVVDTL